MDPLITNANPKGVREINSSRCKQPELSSCSDQEIINLRQYNWFIYGLFLARIIEAATSPIKMIFQTSNVILSVIMESLGENGIYLHGFTLCFALIATHVPIIFVEWMMLEFDLTPNP